MSKYNKAPADTFKHVQFNAAMLLSAFDLETWSFNRADIIGATTGAVNFAENATINDYGEDVNGIKNRTKQLQRVEDRDPTVSATFVAFNMAQAAKLCAGGKVDQSNSRHIIPQQIDNSSFQTLYMVGDYGDINDGSAAGVMCVVIHNAMNTAGFQWSSNKNAKGQFTAEFHGFNDLEQDQDTNYEIYIKEADSSADTPSILISAHSAAVQVGSTVTLTATEKRPSTATVTWSSSDSEKASVSGGVVTGVAAGSAIITASITVSGVTYTDTCTVVVSAASST